MKLFKITCFVLIAFLTIPLANADLKSPEKDGKVNAKSIKIKRKKKASSVAKFTATSISSDKVRLNFSKSLKLDLNNIKAYRIFPPLDIIKVSASFDNKTVLVNTATQEETSYTIKIDTKKAALKKKARSSRASVRLRPDTASFSGQATILAKPEPTPQPTPVPDTSLPFMIGAISTGNNTVVVGYSEAMGDSAINPLNYAILQENVNPEVGAVKVISARFTNETRLSVELTTLPQNEVTYRVKVTNVFDAAGNPIQARQAGVTFLIDPASATFAGTPAGGTELVDTDGDFLSDAEEQRGWKVTVLLASGEGTMQEVTSDPSNPDTDLDGLPDGLEKALVINPRDTDTDDDQVTDYQEFNEIYSDPTKQDSDQDGLYDGLEWDFFKTSPIFEDTDGDQLGDDLETITANRNARIADLPLPLIEVGDINLALDVRFAATSSTGTRDLETQNITSTLTQTENKSFSNTDSTTHEVTASATVEQGWDLSIDGGAEGSVSVEAGYTGQWTSSFTQESSKETQKEVAKSFQTEKEVTKEETVTRTIEGAAMQVGVTIKSLGNLSFTVSNLEITAFMQDPRKPGRLIPIATLEPDSGSPNSFAMGPLVQKRGPFIFKNDQIFPSLVQDLMLDPRGLIFKVANYDITDELGRNFAFTSQEINDRTSSIVIDFGGADKDNDGEGDNSERYRVATNSGRLFDTNSDGIIDENDRRVTFDPNGKQLGITLQDALENIIGLTYYKEEDTPTSGLSQLEREQSFSTKIVNGIERIWRIRQVSKETGNPLKDWVVIGKKGISQAVPFETQILLPENGITLAFVQDSDNDLITATWEYIYGCSDNKTDTDQDGISDFNEVYEGALIQVAGKGTYTAFSSCARTDSDLDGLTDDQEYNRTIDVDTDGDSIPDVFGVAAPTDPKNPDTDGDGMSDFDELNGYTIELRFPVDSDNNGSADIFVVTVVTDPLNPDTDGDTVKDGDEFTLGIDPTVDDGDKVFDDDNDGLRNFEETTGATVKYFQKSTVKNVQGVEKTCTVSSNADCSGLAPTSLTNNPDSDGDGLTDKQERTIGTHPRIADTDGDGLTDFQEVDITFPGGVETISNKTNPLDADTDNDLRSDGEEINNSWIVAVNKTGEAPFSVFSNPLIADEDLDGLVDGEELLITTNPTLPDGFDTDDDGFGDGAEVAASRGTDPLTPDQKVRFTYTNIKVVGDCDSGSDGSDQWVGKLQLKKSTDASATTYVDLYTSGVIDDVDEGLSATINAGTTFTLSEGQSVTASSSTLCEQDGASDGNCSKEGDPDDIISDFSETFDYIVSSQVKIYMQNEEGDSSCQLDITLNISPVL